MDAVVIEFIGDTRGLQPAADQLKALGQISQQEYDKFVSSNQKGQEAIESFEKRMKEQKESAVKNLKEQTEAFNQMEAAIPIGAIKEHGEQMEKTAKKGTTLKSQLKAIKEEMAQLEMTGQRNTQRFKELAQQGGHLTDQLGDTSAQLRALGSDEKYIQGIGQAMTGLVGAFSAGQGAVALFGDENEDLQKTMTKLFATMSIVQGLEAAMVSLNKDSAASVALKSAAQKIYNYFVDEATGKLILMRVAAAAAATVGVALLIVGLVEGVKWFQRISDKAEKAALNMKNLGLSTEEYSKLINAGSNATSGLTAELTTYLAIARDITASDNERNAALKFLNEKYGEYLGHLTKENIDTEEVNKKVADYINLKYQQAVVDAYASAITEKEKKFIEAKTAAEEENFKLMTKVRRTGDAAFIKKEEIKFQEEVTKKTDKNSEAMKRLIGQQTEEVKKLIDLQGNFKIVTKHTGEATKKVEELKESIISLTAGADNTIDLLPADQIETDAGTIVGVTKNMYDQLDGYSDESKEKTKADLDEIQQKRIDNFNYAIQVAQQTSDILSGISQNQLDKDLALLQNQLDTKQITQDQFDKEAKEAKIKKAKQDKAISFFNTILNTASAITGILAATAFDPTGILRTIQIAIASTIGAAQLAVIAGQPIPAFAVGTKEAPSGFKWVGEKGPELIYDKGGYPIISNPDSMALLSMLSKYNIPNVPTLSEAQLSMMGAGMGVPGIGGFDYDKLGDVITRKSSQKSVNVNIDRDGLEVWVENAGNRTKYLNQKFRN